MQRDKKGRWFKGFKPWNTGLKLNYAGHTKPHTEEAKKKMSEALKGRVAHNKGKKLPIWWRKKLSLAKKGKPLSPENREAIRVAMQRFRGKNNPHWRGGRIERNKYILVVCPPRFKVMAKKDGYVMEHRLVMARVLGRNLLRTEVVDHINRDTCDNRPENLRVYKTNGKHLAETLKKNSPQDLLRQKK